MAGMKVLPQNKRLNICGPERASKTVPACRTYSNLNPIMSGKTKHGPSILCLEVMKKFCFVEKEEENEGSREKKHALPTFSFQ